MSTVKLLAHRGASALYPENTLLSFKKAVEFGADGIELDIQLTKDQQIVVLHDFVINRMYQGEGAVKQLDLYSLKAIPLSADIQKKEHYDESWIEERIPTLEEVLQILPQNGDFLLNIELKTDGEYDVRLVEKLLPLLAAYPSIHYVISSFCVEALEDVKRWSNYETAWLVEDQSIDIADVYDPQYMDSLHADKKLLFAGKLDRFFEQYTTTPVRIWTVNDVMEKKQCFAYPISAIFSDIIEKPI